MYIMVMADEPSKRLYDYFDPEQFKDVDLMLFDKVIAFDHFRQKIILIVNIRCEVWDRDLQMPECRKTVTSCRVMAELQHLNRQN